MPGKIYIVGTPIGNLEDITFRAVRTLKEVDLVLAEDTRRSIKLFNTYSIETPLMSYNAHNAEMRNNKVKEMLIRGKALALISDAGMPVISDPGREIISLARETGADIDVIPGPSALTTALTASGFDTTRVLYLGFLPRGKRRRRLFREIADVRATLVFYESPHRLQETLKDVLDILGEGEVFIAREMTKLHQEYRLLSLSRALIEYKGREVKGEITVLIQKNRR